MYSRVGFAAVGQADGVAKGVEETSLEDFLAADLLLDQVAVVGHG